MKYNDMNIFSSSIKKTYLLCFVLISLVAVSCQKGAQGELGTTGDQGIQGVNGLDGKVVYSGPVAPSAETGANGDLYINTSSSEIYGPKTAEGWGTPFSLKGLKGEKGPNGINGQNGTNGRDGINGSNGKDGKDGTNGKDGSALLSGMDAPQAFIGKPGDFYIDKSRSAIYGPRTESGWGAGLSISSSGSDSGIKTIFITGLTFSVAPSAPPLLSTGEIVVVPGGDYASVFEAGSVKIYFKLGQQEDSGWHDADFSGQTYYYTPTSEIFIYRDLKSSTRTSFKMVGEARVADDLARSTIDIKVVLIPAAKLN